jgi:uncharacterized BrkB/YihY/UPF0761 family membrane protein
MQLNWMLLAILVLTWMAAYAMRRLEEEVNEHYDVDQRMRDASPPVRR